MIAAPTLATVAAAASLLFVARPATANGVTFPIADGVSGPYEYEVGVGPFSPLRTALLVAVTLAVDGSPVIDADVTFTVSVDGSSDNVGPLEAAHSLSHPSTYEVSLDLPELPRETISFRIGVDGRQSAAVIEAGMIVPQGIETFNDDPPPAGPQSDQEETSRGRHVYVGLAVLFGGVCVGLGIWSAARCRHRRNASGSRPRKLPDP